MLGRVHELHQQEKKGNRYQLCKERKEREREKEIMEITPSFLDSSTNE